jgi:hypothetical protein
MENVLSCISEEQGQGARWVRAFGVPEKQVLFLARSQKGCTAPYWLCDWKGHKGGHRTSLPDLGWNCTDWALCPRWHVQVLQREASDRTHKYLAD